MIEAKEITKVFEGFTAVNHLDITIKDAEVFGLVGTNGAGKSTFLKMAVGIYRPDAGEVRIDGENVWENKKVKEQIFYISDDQYYFPNWNAMEMAGFYKKFYAGFDTERFNKLLDAFELPKNRRISTYSKGMKKQLSILLGLSSGARYLFCDETFDGLDPVMRQAVKSLIAGDMTEHGLTPVITSHNLRELEDICDHIGLLHKGGIILSRDLDDMKLNIHKVQCVLQPGVKLSDVPELKDLDIIIKEQRGSLYTLTIRGSREDTDRCFALVDTVFYEIVPLTLEEIFISETEVKGYDVKKLIL